MSDDRVMFTLDRSEEVTHWYNVVADLPTPPPPPLHPGTHQPVGPDDLAPLFPVELIMQEVSEALEAVETGEEKVIVIGLSGHGLLELGAYDSFLSGRLEDDPLSDADLARALASVPEV